MDVNGGTAWELHDATLELIVVDWPLGSAELRLRSGTSGTLVLRVAGLTEITVPRNQPWGPSVSVNEIRSLRCDVDSRRMEVEMQSGDVILLIGREFQLRAAEDQP
jgi:hypothetical protein